MFCLPIDRSQHVCSRDSKWSLSSCFFESFLGGPVHPIKLTEREGFRLLPLRFQSFAFKRHFHLSPKELFAFCLFRWRKRSLSFLPKTHGLCLPLSMWIWKCWLTPACSGTKPQARSLSGSRRTMSRCRIRPRATLLALPRSMNGALGFPRVASCGPCRTTTRWSCTTSTPTPSLRRVNLKFINLSTTISRVSVRNMNESEREGEKQIASK
jgi:hypothetical protein